VAPSHPCPEGTFENSPMLQHWVWMTGTISPEGTTEPHLVRTWVAYRIFQSSLRDSDPFVVPLPTLKRWAIIIHPSGVRARSSGVRAPSSIRPTGVFLATVAPSHPCPEGTFENSPMLQHWVWVGRAQDAQVPKGRLTEVGRSAVPPGLRHRSGRNPTLKRWAILKHPSGMLQGRLPSRI